MRRLCPYSILTNGTPSPTEKSREKTKMEEEDKQNAHYWFVWSVFTHRDR